LELTENLNLVVISNICKRRDKGAVGLIASGQPRYERLHEYSSSAVCSHQKMLFALRLCGITSSRFLRPQQPRVLTWFSIIPHICVTMTASQLIERLYPYRSDPAPRPAFSSTSWEAKGAEKPSRCCVGFAQGSTAPQRATNPKLTLQDHR
jgi:hypothetical protein